MHLCEALNIMISFAYFHNFFRSIAGIMFVQLICACKILCTYYLYVLKVVHISSDILVHTYLLPRAQMLTRFYYCYDKLQINMKQYE